MRKRDSVTKLQQLEKKLRVYEQQQGTHDKLVEKKITTGKMSPILCTVEICDSSDLITAKVGTVNFNCVMNLDDFDGYAALREHLITTTCEYGKKFSSSGGNLGEGCEVSVIYGSPHNTQHQVVPGEPWAYFKSKCARLYVEYYPKTSPTSGNGCGGETTI